MPKAGVRQSASRREAQESRDAAEAELEAQLGELEDQAEDALSPLAEFLADSTKENAAKLVQLASAGLLTLRDVQAGIAQEVITMTMLEVTDEDAEVLAQKRMVRVQVQRCLKMLESVVRKGSGGGPQIDLDIIWPEGFIDDNGDQVKTEAPPEPVPADEIDEDLEDELDEENLEEDDA